MLHLDDQTIYVVSADVSDIANQEASQVTSRRLMCYQPSLTNQRCLNVYSLHGCPILTTRYGLELLRENQRFDPILSQYRVKLFGSTVSGSVPFCSNRDPF